MTTEIPPKKTTTTLAEATYTSATGYPNGVVSPSVLVNLTAGQNFTVSPPTARTPPAAFTRADVYVDIVDPIGSMIERIFVYGTDQAVTRWEVSGWNGAAAANVTGTYNITANSEPPISFIKLSITNVILYPGSTQHPYSDLFYPAVSITIGGVVITILGVLAGIGRRTPRARLQKNSARQALS
jgi:hypothetical protein